MGITNRLLKTGPGSPGVTAKTFADAYNNIINFRGENHNENWRGIYSELFMQRYYIAQILNFQGGNLLRQVDPNAIIEFSNGDMALFVFNMMLLETSQFRYHINNAFNEFASIFNEVLSVFHEVIESEAPSALRFDLHTLQLKASQIMKSYQDNNFFL